MVEASEFGMTLPSAVTETGAGRAAERRCTNRGGQIVKIRTNLYNSSQERSATWDGRAYFPS